MSIDEPLRIVDLFAGTGAFSLAFENTGYCDVVFANDMCKNSKKIYDINFDHELTLKNLHDIHNDDIPDCDVLSAGFPCQPFSIAGEQKGFEDERSNVFWKLKSIIEDKKPHVAVLENVKNLQSHDNGKTFKIIKDSLEEIGYHLRYKVLNTCKITRVPQNRERIYIVAFRKKKQWREFNLDFIEPETRVIEHYLDSNVPDKYYYTPNAKIYDTLAETMIKKNVIYQYRRYYVRENKSGLCPTLTANMGTGGHNVPLILDDIGIRKLTPRECFNLQGFKESYKLDGISDAGLYKLAGNAVSYPVVSRIAKKIVKLFI